jgi:hypothetical protein
MEREEELNDFLRLQLYSIEALLGVSGGNIKLPLGHFLDQNVWNGNDGLNNPRR